MKWVRRIVRWAGVASFLFGTITIAWGLLVVIRYQTGWGLTPVQRCCDDQWGIVALAAVLSGMFFVLVGAGAFVVSRVGVRRPRATDDGPPRWARPVAVTLFLSGFAAIALATVFAGMTSQFGGATAGIVTYCMLIGVGLLFSAWGLKRAAEPEEKPEIG